MSNSEFTEMDLHCIARLVQSSFRAPEQKTINTTRELYGCMYCKYAFECGRAIEKKGEPFHFKKMIKKLEELTGVHVSYCQYEPDTNNIGRNFFPGSYYIEHPEAVHELGRVHPECMIDGFRDCLEEVIARSREKFDQKQGSH